MDGKQSNGKKQLLQKILDSSNPSTGTEMAENTIELVPNVCERCGDMVYGQHESCDTCQETVTDDSSEQPASEADLDVLMSQLSLVQRNSAAREHFRKVLHHFSLTQWTKRVLHCPATKCLKEFPCTQMFRHVAFEHKRVPSYIIHLYQVTMVDFDVGIISMGETVVLAQLAIPRQLADEAISISEDVDSAFTFHVFAAKQPLTRKQPEQISLLNIWVSGYVAELFTFTLEVFTDDRSISYASHGFVNSLGESNRVLDIFQSAQCLMLHSANVNRMSQNENFTMHLKIIIGCRGIDDY